ncbi:MAG: protoporphyrinogen oxidase [Candidatus Omnitrophota bacterium]
MTVQVNVQKRNPRLGRHAVIIGGGISGLSSAFFLSRRAAEEHFPLRITVLEASNRLGGVLRTLTHESLHMEAGADAFYAGQNDTLDLCRKLGLQEDVIEASPCFRRFFGLKNKQLYPIPGLSGSFSDVFRFLNSPRLSFFGKCRMLGEPFIPRRKEDGDESLASFIRRRLGQGFYQEVVKPLAQGVCMMNPERLSLEALFPRLRQVEKTHGSLAGSFLNKTSWRKEKVPAEFLTLRQGLEGLVHALVRELGRCELRRSSPVRQCAYNAGWEIFMEDGTLLCADILGFAMNACDASKLLFTTAPELSLALSTVRYDSIAAVNLIYKAGDVLAQGPDFGFLVPMGGERCPFSSFKWLGKSSDGKHLLMRAFLSETMLPKVFHENDALVKQRMQTFMSDFFGVHAKPLLIDIERYPSALPQYETGHFDRVKRIEKKGFQYPGLFFTGNGFHGFGITDCIRQSRISVSSLQLSNL